MPELTSKEYEEFVKMRNDPVAYLDDVKKRKREELIKNNEERLAKEANFWKEKNRKFESVLKKVKPNWAIGQCTSCNKSTPLTDKVCEFHYKGHAVFAFWVCTHCKTLNASYCAFEQEASGFSEWLSNFLQEVVERSLPVNPESFIRQQIENGEIS